MLSLNPDDLARDYLAGEPISSLAKRLGFDKATIRKRLLAQGVSLRTQAESARLAHERSIATEDVVRRFQAGEATIEIARQLQCTTGLVRGRLIRAGIPFIGKQEAGRRQRRKFDVQTAAARYEAGETEAAIAASLKITRGMLRQRLAEAGVRLRTPSETQTIQMAKITPEVRSRRAQSAHAAIRGRPQSEEHRCKIALTVERKGNVTSPGERSVAEWLSGLGVAVQPLKAVGRYNVDVALTESRIAVEIFGGNWHVSGRHALRYRKRFDYLLDRGWLPVVVWVTAGFPLRYRVAEQVFSLHQIRCQSETVSAEEHVIRGDGYIAAISEVNPDNGAIVARRHGGKHSRG